MQEISRKWVAVAAFAVIGATLTGCSKKDNYAADTSAAVDTTAMTASSTAPVMQDTSTTATTTKSTTKTSTAKKAPKKPSY